MKKLFIGCFNSSVILTYIGLTSSLLGISHLLFDDLSVKSNMNIVMLCLIVAGICDLFDGSVARSCERNETQKAFGIQIDSLVDVVSFLVFPAIILLKTNPYTFIIAVVYAVSGITRLAWFNMHTDGHTEYYQGLPVTFVSFILPILYILKICPINILFPIVLAVLSILFVLNVPIKKPKSVLSYCFFSLLALGAIIALIC